MRRTTYAVFQDDPTYQTERIDGLCSEESRALNQFGLLRIRGTPIAVGQRLRCEIKTSDRNLRQAAECNATRKQTYRPSVNADSTPFANYSRAGVPPVEIGESMSAFADMRSTPI